MDLGRITGRVRAVGKGVGIKYYFEAAPRHSSSYVASEIKAKLKSKIRQELMEEMRKEIERVQLEL